MGGGEERQEEKEALAGREKENQFNTGDGFHVISYFKCSDSFTYDGEAKSSVRREEAEEEVVKFVENGKK